MSGKGMSFIDAFEASIKECPELYENFERLYGEKTISVLRNRSAIEIMVDKASGHDHSVLIKMMAQFSEFVWSRLPDEAFEKEAE